MLKPDQVDKIKESSSQIGQQLDDAIFEEVLRRLREIDPAEIRTKRQLQQVVSRLLAEVKAGRKAAETTAKKETKTLIRSVAKVAIQQDGGGEYAQECTEIINRALEEAISSISEITRAAGYEVDKLPWQMEDAFSRSAEKMVREVWEGKKYMDAFHGATKELAERGILSVAHKDDIDDETEPETYHSIESVMRTTLLSTLGKMQDSIEHQMADLLGTDGWEVTAHACSAPDHEPIQGRQYSNEEYEALNSSLVRRIGTLNCGHSAFPIMLGQEPQYTEEELDKLREDNERGVTINGKHYTGYEATQKQREYERRIRKQKRRLRAADASGDALKIKAAETKLRMLQKEYRQFSYDAGLRLQTERTWIPEQEELPE